VKRHAMIVVYSVEVTAPAVGGLLFANGLFSVACDCGLNVTAQGDWPEASALMTAHAFGRDDRKEESS
jgi:hypothetical protein